VVDDDIDIRPMMKLLLTRMGHIPTIAGSGKEGLEAALHGSFDLVILDLMMPDLDGYEVARRLRADAHTRHLPILVFTARIQAADEANAMEAGADAFLPKMSDPQDLNNKIAEMLKLGQARRAGEAPIPGASAAAPTAAPPTTGPISPPPPAVARLPVSKPTTAPTGRVTVALGLRGGVGATTVAVNLAGALLRLGRRVCLVDLSPSVGHVSLQLRLRSQTTWADLPSTPDMTVIGQALSRHDSGLYVLPAPQQPMRHGLAGETFQAILTMLRSGFAEIVIDSAHMLDDATCLALTAAQCALVVLAPEVGAVHSVVGTRRALAALSVTDNRVRFALNHVSLEPPLPSTAVEKALGRAPDLVVPFDRAQAGALAQGIPLVFAQPQAVIPTVIGTFAAKL
jgi:CheY-like chemotaxis protein/MinD-like ATPase involved in chromosome partitioning or flagellar assembly